MHIDLDGYRLFFDVYGSKLKILDSHIIEKPTLIVLHGGHGMVDHTLYVEFWSQFADIAQVIFLDQRGCGRSESTDSSQWNLKHWGNDVYLFCKALQIEKPIIAGVSMGGHVICEYVNQHPEHPLGLIFCNTEARFVLDDVCAKMLKQGGQEVAEITRKQFTNPTPEVFTAYQKLCLPYYAKNAYSPAEINRCIKNNNCFSHYIRNEMLIFNYLDSMKKIQCPTLFMVGEDSPFHPLQRTQEMIDRMKPNLAELNIFKNAGAPVYKDAPNEAFKVVNAFLTKFHK